MTACFALLAHGLAYHDADPVAAYDALRRAPDGRRGERQPADGIGVRSRAAVMARGYRNDPIHFFEYLTVAIHHYDDSGNVANLRNPLAIFAALLDRLGHHEQAATISGFAASAFTLASSHNSAQRSPISAMSSVTSLRIARPQGRAMTTAAMATYAYDQIDQARAEFEHSS